MRDCCIPKIILTTNEGNSIFGTIGLLGLWVGYQSQGGITVVKEWKSKRQLSLFVALALSAGGGQLYHHSAYAADVSGQNV